MTIQKSETFESYQWDASIIDASVIISGDVISGFKYFVGTVQIFSGDLILTSNFDGHKEVCSSSNIKNYVNSIVASDSILIDDEEDLLSSNPEDLLIDDDSLG